jgi:hypothetical protein
MISENIFLEISKKVQNLGFKQSLIHISSIAMDEMGINTFSVRTFEEDDKLKCRFRRVSDSVKFTCSDITDLAKYPVYLEALKSQKVLKINDIYNDYRVSEYLNKFEDCLQYGMVFFSKNVPYNWTNNDVVFGSDVSQVISIAYISSKRNEDLRKLNSYAEKIKSFNAELQELIKRKNEQFIEYGFINSHLLNAPLSRLKGLMNILMIELDNERREEEIKFITEKIFEEYDAMDEIVKRISVLVDKGASDK